MNWTFEMTMYLLFAVSIFACMIVISKLADEIGIAEFERDLANYELEKLRAYKDAKETYDSQG